MPMNASTDAQTMWELPEGCVAVPVQPGAVGPLRICAVTRTDAAAGTPFVALRDLLDARVVLGCVVDAAGAVQQWLELWIQDVDSLGHAPFAAAANLTNPALDQRWIEQYHALARLDPRVILHTGWETEHPAPTFLDLAQGAAVCPVEPDSGKPWRLCTDDALLRAKGLPAYSTSLHRYLCVPELGEASPLVPATRDAPDAGGPTLAELMSDRPWAPLNPGGGLMLVRSLSPVGFEAYMDLLGGRAWQDLVDPGTALDLGPAWRELAADRAHEGHADGRLFMGRHGRQGRLLEALHLKLCALTDTVEAVRRFTGHAAVPRGRSRCFR